MTAAEPVDNGLVIRTAHGGVQGCVAIEIMLRRFQDLGLHRLRAWEVHVRSKQRERIRTPRSEIPAAENSGMPSHLAL